MKTIIKPVKENDEFDVDLLIYCTENEKYSPEVYLRELERIFRENKNYSHMVKRKTRCTTLDYAGDFHLDLVPCIEIEDQTFICNSKENEFEESDGTGYRQWLIDKTSYTYGELKRVTRLMKYLRDHKDNFSVKSILLTTLLGNSVDSILPFNFTDTPTALLKIVNSLNKYLQAHPTMPIIKNPVLPNESFNRHWDQKKYDNFRDKIAIYDKKIEDAYYEENRNESIRKWRKLFGDRFGTIHQKSSNPEIAITPRKPHVLGW